MWLIFESIEAQKTILIIHLLLLRVHHQYSQWQTIFVWMITQIKDFQGYGFMSTRLSKINNRCNVSTISLKFGLSLITFRGHLPSVPSRKETQLIVFSYNKGGAVRKVYRHYCKCRKN